MRSTFLPFHVPDIGEADIDSVVATLRSGWLTGGPRVRDFEAEFAKYLGARHAVAVNSGTAALHLALMAAGLGAGDEVIVPTMTFAATAEVILHVGARPVLIDSERSTLNLDPAKIEEALTARTRAILPVHLGGHPCDMDSVGGLAREHGFRVIEDAAHCFPARYHDRWIGTLGDLTCFSFYATKTLTTGEGGMVVTERPEWAKDLALLRLHGISRLGEPAASEESWEYEILKVGFKYNLSDIGGALGIEQLRRAESSWSRRKRIAAMYGEGLQNLPEIETPTSRPDVEPSWHLYTVRLRLPRLRINRREFITLLKARNIGSSVHFKPLHLHPLYRDVLGYRPERFPVANEEWLRIVSLPIYPSMTDGDVRDVIEAIHYVAETHRR